MALGRPEEYLSRITEVAREVVKGNALTEKAQAAMARDRSNALNKSFSGRSKSPQNPNWCEIDG